MVLTIFDLDYTLLDDDCELSWSKLLFENRIVDERFVARLASYFADYDKGNLDMFAYESFLLSSFSLLPGEKLLHWRDIFLGRIREVIRPAIAARVNWHRSQKHELLLITAANSFLAEPVARMLGFSNLICTQAEVKYGEFTGKITGIPAFRDGKVQLLDQWLLQTGLNLQESWGYSDSHNDLPLLNRVMHPVAVTPDPVLRAYAKHHNWEILEA